MNDIVRAASLAEAAMPLGPDNPLLLNLVAFRRLQQGRPEAAVELLERARVLAPRDINVLNAHGIALKQAGRLGDALQAYDAALAENPDFAAAHYNRALVLEELDDIDAARAGYERAVALNPNYHEALGRLAGLAAKRGDMGQARDLAARALGIDAKNSSALLALALAELAVGELASARARAQAVLAQAAHFPILRANTLVLTADIDDRAGNFAAAFAGYVAGKAEFKRYFAPQFAGPGKSYRERVERTARYFRGADAADWAPREAGGGPCSVHVFLVGFPRSGTTLLDVSLAAHPRVASMEEKPALESATLTFLTPPDGLKRLAGLTASALEPYREAYWRVCRAAVPDLEGRVFIDKLPLNTDALCLVAKLFPAAKILFAIRDPRDVVFSCFRRQFGMNAAMYEFCTLEGSARFYDAVMGLAELYREKLGLEIMDTRYEDLVADFEGQIRRICAFIGVEWHEAMRDIAARASERTLKTPSAPQLARGLYDGGGRWRPYKEELAPVMAILQPWVKRFGYPAD
jgi:Tfp pilus assembly protein PilF